MATRSSGELSMTTRKMRPECFGGSAGAGSALAVASGSLLMGLSPLDLAEDEMGRPSRQQRDDDGDDAVGGRMPMGKFEDIGANADLGDDERRRLGPGDLAVADQQDLHEVTARGNIGRKLEIGAEQAGAPELHPARGWPVQPLPDFDSGQRLKHVGGTRRGVV